MYKDDYVTVAGATNANYNGSGKIALNIPVSTVARASDGTVTVVTPFAHGLVNGDSVVAAGATAPDTSYNGTFTVTVSNATTYTYATGTHSVDAAHAPAGPLVITQANVFTYAKAGSGSAATTTLGLTYTPLVGWWHGYVVRGPIGQWAGYLENQQVPDADGLDAGGLAVTTGHTSESANNYGPLTAIANSGNSDFGTADDGQTHSNASFKVTGDQTNAILILVNGKLKKIIQGGSDGSGHHYLVIAD